MRLNFFEIIFLLSSLLATVGLIVLVYTKNDETKSARLFILILLLIIGYLVSHAIHFVLSTATDVTALDVSCYSILLTILVALTFFSWNFPRPQKMGIIRSMLIIIPSLVVTYLLWTDRLIRQSHIHPQRYEAHYTNLYPILLFWYVILLLVNIYWLIKKYIIEKEAVQRRNILFYLIGLIITNSMVLLFGMYLPWLKGFYFLVEMSPLAFFVGVILFTTMAVTKYDMFSNSLGKVHNLSLNKKIILSALIIVPIIILLIEMPLVRMVFRITSNKQFINYFLLSILGGAIVSVSIAFIIIRIISSPINKLKVKVQEVEEGSFGTQVDLHPNDEIGELAKAFNRMSKTLKTNALELKEKENRILLLLNAFEKSTTAIAILDKDFKIVDVNSKFAELVNLSKEELSGKFIYNIEFESGNDLKFIEIKNSLIETNTYNGEIYFRQRVFLTSITSTSIGGNKPWGYLLIELDITEQKRLEEQLLKTEKLAALGKMAAVLAHEIKTPLTSIKMNADIIAEEYNLNKNGAENFDIIKTEVNRLNNLVKEVLQFSRQTELNYSVINLNQLVENIRSQLNENIKLKNIKFVNNTDSIEINGDADKLRQVFLNLIDNSIEAIEKNGEIVISSTVNNDTKSVKINFVDDGSGVGDISKVFEPFFTTKSSGTGLGLSIAQKIIEQHKGSLKLLSSVPNKTVFEIILPLTEVQQEGMIN